jgi:type IV pilus assembly protein PilA
MLSSVMNRLQDRRDAAADLGEDAGFTLIELMVVLLILAILLAIAIPTFLGVTGGANDRAAQSNLNTALTTVKTAATQNGQSYSTVTFGSLQTNEPSLTWVNGTAVSTQGPVSVYFSADGNGAVLASYSKNNNTCWYAVDNLSAVTNTGGPYGATPVAAGDATHVPTQAGTWYSHSSGTCSPSATPAAAATWGSTFG